MKYGLTTVIALLAAAGAAVPAPAYSSAQTDASESLAHLKNRATTCSKSATDNLLFKASIKTFQKARKAKNPSKCIWTSDNCSDSPDKPDGYNFIPSCQRHDFGYRNTKNQKRFTKAMKKRIDDNLKHDLYNYCSQFSGWESWKGVECRRIADTYYVAVRNFGKRNIEIDPETLTYRKRADHFEDFDGSEVDPDIDGQVIPEIVEGEGEDFDDLEALSAE